MSLSALERELHILILEDVAADVALLNHEMRKGGLRFESIRVSAEREFLDRVREAPPDVILSDHGLPTFDGLAALALARKVCPAVPFIFVTGALGEELAIETFEHGAADYVLKHHLSTLVPAIRRALRAADERARREAEDRERDRLIAELQAALAKLNTLRHLVPICSWCKKIRDDKGYWEQLEVYLQEHFDATLTHGLCPECSQQMLEERPDPSPGEATR
jgi:CheY-like chemotaxis protein